MGVVVGDALGLPVQFSWREELEKDPVTDNTLKELKKRVLRLFAYC